MNKEIGESKLTVHHGVVCALYAMLFYVGAILDKKIDHVFMFTIPGAAWFFIFIYPLSDALTEVYGPKKTWANLVAGYIICSLFILITVVTIHLPYANILGYQTTKNVYLTVQDAIVKCFGFGYLIFFIGMFINVKLLGKWKLKYSGKYYYWRSYVASAISEGFVVVFANLLIWYDRTSALQVFRIIVTTYILKLVLTFGWALIGTWVKNILYAIEGMDSPYIYNQDLYKNSN